MKKTFLKIGFSPILFLLLSCSSLQMGLIRFEGKQDEIIATNKIVEFIKNNPNPSIVLRVPNTEKQATQSDPNGYIYNAIEKELVLANFNVKDRGLFNEVVNKSSGIDYTKIKEITGTELILELVRVQPNVEYSTNRVYTKTGETKIFNNHIIKRAGAAIEFKLIIVENNDYGGSYSFYYTPCSESSTPDCTSYIGYKNFPNKVYPNINKCKSNSKLAAYETVDQNIVEEFVRNGVKRMILEIKK